MAASSNLSFDRHDGNQDTTDGIISFPSPVLFKHLQIERLTIHDLCLDIRTSAGDRMVSKQMQLSKLAFCISFSLKDG